MTIMEIYALSTIAATREKISYFVSGEAARIQAEEVIPYWRGRSMRDQIFRGCLWSKAIASHA